MQRRCLGVDEAIPMIKENEDIKEAEGGREVYVQGMSMSRLGGTFGCGTTREKAINLDWLARRECVMIDCSVYNTFVVVVIDHHIEADRVNGCRQKVYGFVTTGECWQMLRYDGMSVKFQAQ